MSRPSNTIRPARRWYLAGQHLEECALPGAVWADDPTTLTTLHGEIDAVIGDQAAIALGQAFSLQYEFGLAALAASDPTQVPWPMSCSMPKLRHATINRTALSV